MTYTVVCTLKILLIIVVAIGGGVLMGFTLTHVGLPQTPASMLAGFCGFTWGWVSSGYLIGRLF